jgi:D-glycero-D-manno-heptose 1,7-bisphosphate phosphatase
VFRPALFLDRDGVINHDHDYIYRREDIEFIDGIFDLVRQACLINYRVVIVTNQSGIGRGYYTEADFHKLMAWMMAQFVKHGGWIDRVYFCPDHPTEGIGKYRQNSSWRKPKPGMILAAAKELSINLSQSVLVGDRLRDIAAGQAAGVGYTLLYSESVDANDKIHPTARVLNLAGVSPYLL